MVRLVIDGEEFGLNSFWVHYKKPSENNQNYCFIISKSEEELISVIEEYAECSINDQALEANIIRKDHNRRSMGLIWNLNVIFEKKYVHSNDEKIHWVINNVQKVEVTQKDIIINGDATKFDTSQFG